jgi:Flp pilus assembly protein CpaB
VKTQTTIGVGIGIACFFVAMTFVGLLASALTKKRIDDARLGWNLVPVLVAARDLSIDKNIEPNEVEVRAVPDQFVTQSALTKNEMAWVIGNKLVAPMKKGDMFLFSQLHSKETTPAVLFANRDLAVGTTLSNVDVVELAVPKTILTESWVLVGDRPQALGQVVQAPFRKGDPIMWTHLNQTQKGINK